MKDRRLRSAMAACGFSLVCGQALASSDSAVIRPSPQTYIRVGEKPVLLSHFRGQPVVLLLAPSANHRAFRKQVREIEAMYDRFSSSNVLFVAAFHDDNTAPVASNIPFLLASSGSSTCESYGCKSAFGVAIIGADGNLDYQSRELLHASRIREVLQNSFTVQRSLRGQ